jgi:GNAT superfamily N-acetyltransferase
LPGVGPANIAALEALVEIDDDIGTAGPFVPALPGNWETLDESRLTQMIRIDASPLPEGDVDTSVLGARDVAEILALIELTKPGPFRSRTIELGTYIGIREGGRLVAMAGERTWVGDFREVSAVCTHPDAQGRGYARALWAASSTGCCVPARHRSFMSEAITPRRSTSTAALVSFAAPNIHCCTPNGQASTRSCPLHCPMR